jgi:hypothetical protein
MDEQLLEIGRNILDAVISLTNFNALLALLVFVLGYRLLRVGLERVPTGPERNGQYARFILPGAVFSLLGTIVLMGRDPSLLIVFLMTLSVGVGFGLIALGYRLFVKGFLEADPETLWDDPRVLLGRSIPGVLLAIVGVFAIISTLGGAPESLRDYNLEQRETTQEIVSVVDDHLSQALDLFREYLQREGGEQ